MVVEVGLPGGLDVLAAFSEGGARYINQAEKLLVWETQTPESRQLIDELFAASITVVNQIGTWDQPRRPFPPSGMVRPHLSGVRWPVLWRRPIRGVAGRRHGRPRYCGRHAADGLPHAAART